MSQPRLASLAALAVLIFGFEAFALSLLSKQPCAWTRVG